MRCDLVHAPTNFDHVTVRVLESDGDLLTFAAPPFENNFDAVVFQMRARQEHLVERANLIRNMMQLGASRRPACAAD
jgi:hypothetical protein